jgi:hypothetical protein
VSAATELRDAARELRVKPLPLSELIPALQRAADALDVNTAELIRLQAELDAAMVDAEIGRQWRENSSLEKWFPITAEKMKPLTEDQIATMRGLQGTGIHWRLYLETVRAVERAHGIHYAIKETK